jgi:hypothetical protein
MLFFRFYLQSSILMNKPLLLVFKIIIVYEMFFYSKFILYESNSLYIIYIILKGKLHLTIY